MWQWKEQKGQRGWEDKTRKLGKLSPIWVIGLRVGIVEWKDNGLCILITCDVVFLGFPFTNQITLDGNLNFGLYFSYLQLRNTRPTSRCCKDKIHKVTQKVLACNHRLLIVYFEFSRHWIVKDIFELKNNMSCIIFLDLVCVLIFFIFDWILYLFPKFSLLLAIAHSFSS